MPTRMSAPDSADTRPLVSMPRNLSQTSGSLTRAESFARRQTTERGIEVRLPINYGSLDVGSQGNQQQQQNLSRNRSGTELPESSTTAAATTTTAAATSSTVESTQTTIENELARASAAISRYKYYNRVAPALTMPAHVVPSQFLLILPFKPSGGQSSLVTVFSIWNTMMGTSLLSMPWAVKEAGFATSLIVMLIMTGVTFYTAYLVLNSYAQLAKSNQSITEFSDVCRHYLGRMGEIVSICFSAIALLGALIVYWVLLSNFLFESGKFLRNKIYNEAMTDPTQDSFFYNNRSYSVLCPDYQLLIPLPTETPEFLGNFGRNKTNFETLWSKTDTVPFYLAILLLPLVSIKSPEFFSKFNALGTVAVVYIVAFVVVKAITWGFHFSFDAGDVMEFVPQFRLKFPLLTGVLSLALFCHNAVVTLTRHQRQPQHNNRDLLIAYICVSATYTVVGFLFYAVYPLAKDCIAQNFLDNIPNADTLAFTARIFLFVQMLTVFPLLMYILRTQLLYYLFNSVYPSWLHAFVMHILVLAAAISVAHFYPNIGSIIRFSGALCGLAYIFTLPPVIHLLSLKSRGRLNALTCVIHGVIIAAGVANFVSQFLFIGSK